MKKIVIVEDCRQEAINMQKALVAISDVEVVVITRPDLFSEEVDMDIEKTHMPAKDWVIEQVQGADLVLLDYDLGPFYGTPSYTGENLAPHCQRIIGTSNRKDLGTTRNFYGKSELGLDGVQAKLRSVVEAELATL